MNKSILFFFLLFNFIGNAQKQLPIHSIIPAPDVYKTNGDSITINGQIHIITEKQKFSSNELKTVQILENIINSKVAKKTSNFKITFNPYTKALTQKEAYKISISSDGIFIIGQEEGLFYAVQSLLQLLPNHPLKSNEIKLPCVEIEDHPRYSYRGLHLDVSRHFFSTAVIKDLIAQMSNYKLNTFHWHLTDDQGWRIEIKKYPKLTEIGSKRAQTLIGNKFERFPRFFDGNPYGGYYTQEEIKDIVKFAQEHYVSIIPEIEMPGHASAAIASYPNLTCFPSNDFKVIESWGVFEDVFCAGKEDTFVFLQDVLNEVISLFPSTYIHIGGDECPKTKWKQCPNCQKRIKELGLNNEHELQSYFIKRMEKYLNSKGRQILGWDEILEGGLAPNAAVMSWRGESGGIIAAKQKHSVIMTPEDYVYFDHNQGYSLQEPLSVGRLTTLEEVYHYNPTPNHDLTTEEESYIKGVQANLWSEYLTNSTKLNYMLYPRLFALAEIAWTKTVNKNYKNFILNRLPYHLEKLEIQKRLYKVPSPLGIKDTALIASKYILDLKPTINNGQIFYTIDGYNPDETSNRYEQPTTINIPKGEYRIIKTVQISESGKRSSINKIIINNSEVVPSLAINPSKQGLKFRYYQNLFQQTNELDTANPLRSGIHTETIGIKNYKTKEIRYFGIKLEGYIYIDETASYTFSCIADDGAKIVIDNQLVVDNDGRHWINEAFGAIKLQKGFHKINISYFDADGSAELKCYIQQDGKEKVEIKSVQLFYD
ncbi:family 20 glycosylhydrolase [Flavobacterium sp.]|uniref:family 20 glycosylhydrolase n=1 Tax=Flavobacterium sp. TaxID=239 RepID=UPI00262B2039|nr:family 20 glycosylhydrolase [Flavobacterium sp.]